MELALFIAVAGVTVLCAAGVVLVRNVVYAALFLLGALLGVAGVFVLLLAEFLALVQIFIYGGAVIIVVLFALMLTRTTEFRASTENRRWPLAALVSGGLFVMLTVIFVTDSSSFNDGQRRGISMAELGARLFEDWAIPFEIASLILLVALVGAVVLSRTADNAPTEDGPADGRGVGAPPDARERELAGAAGRGDGGGAR